VRARSDRRGVILGAAVAALWGTGDLLAAMAARRFGAFRTLVVAQATELGVCLASLPVLRPNHGADSELIAPLLLAGVLTAVAYGALYRGLMLGPVMLVGPIASAYAVGPTILAVVLLHERLPLEGTFGAVAAIAGVVIVTAARGTREKHREGRRSGVPFALVAMTGFAISAFMIAAFAGRTGWFTPLLVSRIGVALTLVPAALVFRRRSTTSRVAEAGSRAPTLLAIFAGLSNLGGTALYAWAGELRLVAVVSAVSALFPLVPIFGGYVLFGERIGRLQIAGVATIIVGLILLA
jgi:uncharacterized membrane protein